MCAGFPYFTKEKRGYQLPLSENIIYSELPRIKQEKHKKYDRDVELKLLRYCADFGQGIRQQNIRAFTTKDKPGTLPFYMYTEQDDCSAKTSEESFDVFNVLLNFLTILEESIKNMSWMNSLRKEELIPM